MWENLPCFPLRTLSEMDATQQKREKSKKYKRNRPIFFRKKINKSWLDTKQKLFLCYFLFPGFVCGRATSSNSICFLGREKHFQFQNIFLETFLEPLSFVWKRDEVFGSKIGFHLQPWNRGHLSSEDKGHLKPLLSETSLRIGNKNIQNLDLDPYVTWCRIICRMRFLMKWR